MYSDYSNYRHNTYDQRFVDGLNYEKDYINSISTDVLDVCKNKNWSVDWSARGCYLHLESSELIEAVRGKRGDVLSEAADVLIVLMSITENAGIEFYDVIDKARGTVDKLMESYELKTTD